MPTFTIIATYHNNRQIFIDHVEAPHWRAAAEKCFKELWNELELNEGETWDNNTIITFDLVIPGAIENSHYVRGDDDQDAHEEPIPEPTHDTAKPIANDE